MNKYKLAIIGSGSLGSIIGKVVAQDMSEKYEILGVLSGRRENAIKLADEIGCRAYKTLAEIIDDRPDYVIEATSPGVFKEIGVEILASGISLIPLSVGALADKEFYTLPVPLRLISSLSSNSLNTSFVFVFPIFNS